MLENRRPKGKARRGPRRRAEHAGDPLQLKMEKHGRSMPDRVHYRDERVRVKLELDHSHGSAVDT
jgi:hypothetical protein